MPISLPRIPVTASDYPEFELRSRESDPNSALAAGSKSIFARLGKVAVFKEDQGEEQGQRTVE